MNKYKIPIEEYPKPKEICNAGFKTFVAFDVETTGLDSTRDSMIELAAIKVIDGKIVNSKDFIFQELIHPYKKRIPEYIEGMTGITNDMVHNAREMWDVFTDFYEFSKDYIWVGYNCMSFDSKFLARAGRYSNIKIYNEFFDVMKYAYKFKEKLNYTGNKISLNSIADIFEIENPNAHRSLSDAITTAKVYMKLLEMDDEIVENIDEEIIQEKAEQVSKGVECKKKEKSKKSCAILFEYGATASHVNTIMNSNYSLEELKYKPEKLTELFGDYKSIKIKEIINKIKDLNQKSIFELCEYGLSKGIADELFEKKITIEMLEIMNHEQLYDDFKVGKSASKKVYSALGKYNNIDYFEEKINYAEIIKKEILKYDKKVISVEEFLENPEIEKLDLKDIIYEKLKEVEKQESIILYSDKIIIKHEKLLDAINKYIKIDTRKDVIIGVFKGAKQVELAEKMGVTRERARQIFNAALKELPNILEEDIIYKEIFSKYNIEKELFIELFDVDEIVYGYLENKYDKGEESITKLLDTDYFDVNEENVIKKYNKLITYNGLTIKEDKMQLLLAILQTEAIQYNISDLIDKYNEEIKNNNYNLEKINDIHNIESVLARQKSIIASNKRRYRYYNYDLLTQGDIEELSEILDVDDGAYYTDYFFDRNRDLMDKINIIDKNELYNLMKRLFSDEENILFSNMPIVLIGYNTKDEFLEEKMNNLSPISVEEFSQRISEEYGHAIDSLKAYISKTYYSYITKGIINIEAKSFEDDEIEKLRDRLTEYIYSIKELKEILFDLFGKDCSEYIKTTNFEKLNFRIREQYIFRVDAGTVDEIIKKEILKNSIFNLNKTRLKGIGSSFWWEFYELIGKNKLIKYDANLYYTEKGLAENNINIDRIESFKKEIYEKIKDDEIFTLYNIKKLGICEKYQDLNINEIFLENIIKTIKGVKNVSIENNVVFLKSNKEFFNKADLIEKIILDNELTKIGEIKEFLKIRYDVYVDSSKLKELINLKKYDIEDERKTEIVLENESIENASDDYNIMMVFKFIEKIFGIGVHKKFGDDKNSEFLKRFDNSLNTLSQKEKRVVILKNGLKNGVRMTAEEVAEKMEIVSANSVGNIDRTVIEKLKEEDRTRILRTYFDFSNSEFEDSTADFILDLLK